MIRRNPAEGDVPTLNSVELTDTDGVAEALSYYNKPYNEGQLDRAHGGEMLQIYSRIESRFDHMDTLIAAYGHPDSVVVLGSFSIRERDFGDGMRQYPYVEVYDQDASL